MSTPVTWKEVERGVRIEDFTIAQRARRGSPKLGDLWKPLLAARGRFDLGRSSNRFADRAIANRLNPSQVGHGFIVSPQQFADALKSST